MKFWLLLWIYSFSAYLGCRILIASPAFTRPLLCRPFGFWKELNSRCKLEIRIFIEYDMIANTNDLEKRKWENMFFNYWVFFYRENLCWAACLILLIKEARNREVAGAASSTIAQVLGFGSRE